MAVDWPSSPTVGQIYTSGSRSWICVSASPVVWQAQTATSIASLTDLLMLGGM